MIQVDMISKMMMVRFNLMYVFIGIGIVSLMLIQKMCVVPKSNDLRFILVNLLLLLT